jgi:predicted acylesterase/phospholipase RssA
MTPEKVAVPALAGEAAPHVPALAAAPGDAGPRRSLVLAGGGIRLAYGAGVLVALEEEGLSFAHVDATSGGALNAAMLLSGLAPREMAERWRTLDVRDTLSLMAPSAYLDPLRATALGSARGFTGKVFPHLGIDLPRLRAATGIEGTFNVLDYLRKTVEVIPHPRLDEEMLVAGMSLPGVMPPVERNGRLYLDCAFVLDANPLEAVRRGAEELWLVWVLGNTGRYLGGPLHTYVQMLEMAANGALVRDFGEIADINRRVERGETVRGRVRAAPVRLHVIRPQHPLPLDPELYTGRVTFSQLVDMGYADARRYLASRPAEGLPFTPETIMMSTPASPGITFSEVMKGPFALGATDPREGRAAGKAQKTELAMHATVSVRDMERFIADPEHTGSLTGSIDFTPFGQGIPAGEGIFNLFSPADDPQMKLMVYELPFQHGGESYYLAGRKEVKDDPGFDLWSDTTTLYTTLHRGTGKDGPVVGAGVLTLGIADFAKVVAGVRVTDAGATTDIPVTLARFGKFFAGELWDSYASLAR